MLVDLSLITIGILIIVVCLIFFSNKDKHKKADDENQTFSGWGNFQNREYRELLDTYNNCNKNYYDFRRPFQDKLKEGKHLTSTEIITLVGIAPTIKDQNLQKQLYQTIIEELVLIVTSEKT